MGIRMSLHERRNRLPENFVLSEILPKELIFSEILSKLPAKSLIRFKSVSREWRDLIAKDTMLKKAHARHLITSRNSGEISIIALKKKNDRSDQKLVLLTGDNLREFETPRELKDLIFEEIMSSNGLVLVLKPLMLWNPATKEFRFLPEPLADGKVPEVLGLGFDEESGDHKVVRVTRDQNLQVWLLYLQVFSKRAGSWRKLRPVPGFIVRARRARVSSDEALYFLAWEPHLPGHKTVVMSFTYRNEEVRKVTDGPDCFSLPNKRLRLVRWKDDSLALFSCDQTSEKLCEFWVMTKNDGDDEGFCWSKIFVFYCNIRVICGFWSDRILIARNRMTELALLDPRYGNCLVIAELNKPLCYFGVVTHYVPTLLSVYSDP